MSSQASQQASELFSPFPRHHQHGRGGNHNESGIHEERLRGSVGRLRSAHQFAGHQSREGIYSNATRVLLGCSACLSTVSTWEYFFTTKWRPQTYWPVDFWQVLFWFHEFHPLSRLANSEDAIFVLGLGGLGMTTTFLVMVGTLVSICSQSVFCWIVFSAFLTPDAKYDAAWLVCWLQKYTGWQNCKFLFASMTVNGKSLSLKQM